ncbi:MAG: [NiFe]-hydrogenase assembly chaperone HybE [Gammaproteobacteria bacterium]|nr:[NiFe]-hydrogenase assembly chaperone HybE [Gammaproteobacteria bacterium]MBU1775543.1 [NiFe]-hydrogenase assembly chaperone HybE [Gammaproteobacteria bacterium]MBU1969500.1 [NiFe]-hydrogenase assembly chaperone HybE [Gammaproteobacteria bacterium]
MTIDPAGKLEAVFSDIAATRMAGLPICNEALRVEAVGFREWQGHWVGVLVTPWTISLALMPGEGGPLKTLGPDEKMSWEFPSGKYEFMGLNEPALGTCQTCSLISPVIHIERHEDAVAVAEQVMTALFAVDKPDVIRDEERKQMFEAARMKGEPVAAQEVSRRDFLRGAFLGM